MPSFNFSDVFDNAASDGFGPSEDLIPGKYVGKFVSANAGESNNGDPKLGFLFKADEGSTAADGTDVSGDTIWLNSTFSEKAAPFAALDCTKMGITGAMLNADMAAAAQTVVGQVWSVEVKLSKDGQWTNLYLGKRRDAAPAAAPVPKPVPVPVEPASGDADAWTI